MNGLRNKNLLLRPPSMWKRARELSDATWEKEEETKKSPAGVKTKSRQPTKMFD